MVRGYFILFGHREFLCGRIELAFVSLKRWERLDHREGEINAAKGIVATTSSSVVAVDSTPLTNAMTGDVFTTQFTDSIGDAGVFWDLIAPDDCDVTINGTLSRGQ